MKLFGRLALNVEIFVFCAKETKVFEEGGLEHVIAVESLRSKFAEVILSNGLTRGDAVS